MKLISLVIVAAALAASAYGQSQTVVSSPATEMVVEIADQPGCPLNLTTRIMSGGRMQIISLVPSTLSDKPIVGYHLVLDGETRQTMYGMARPGDPVVKGVEAMSFGVGGGSDDRHFVVSVDYVEFSDGTGWGGDALKQSERIKKFVRGWNVAITRLRDIAAEYSDPAFFIRRGALGGRTSWSGPIPSDGKIWSGPRDPEDTAYDSVLVNLRLPTAREAEAQEIERKLELMRTPYPKDK